MTGKSRRRNDLQIKGFPAVEGVTLRRYQGPSDLSAMAEVMTSSRRADGVDYVTTEADLKAQFSNPIDFDPMTDIVIVEAKGKIVGLARVWRESRRNGKKVFGHSVELLQEWRGRRIRETLFQHNERHIRDVAKDNRREGAGFFELWAIDTENEWRTIVESNGYKPVQHEIDMVRSLDHVQEMPLPDGFEIRPVVPEHLSKIQEACKESMRRDWNFSENMWDDQHFEVFKKSHAFQPNLWQVAWKGETLAGMILNFVVEEENREYQRKRGHTEYVFVREQYRGKGLARALLARSLQVLKDQGMTEAMLSMEIENPHDPMRLYKGMGFKVEKHFTWYHKPIA